jgi:hypothetical protein
MTIQFNNKILKSTLANCKSLKTLDMLNNPIIPQLTNLRRNIILASSTINTFNGRNITVTERACLVNMERAKRKIKHQKSIPGVDVGEEEEQGLGGVVPHLPAYASQYRDMIIHQLKGRKERVERVEVVSVPAVFENDEPIARIV